MTDSYEQILSWQQWTDLVNVGAATQVTQKSSEEGDTWPSAYLRSSGYASCSLEHDVEPALHALMREVVD